MNPVTVVAGLDILFTVLTKAAELSTLIQEARDEDRDISPEEWKKLDLNQAEAHAKLKESVEQRQKEET
ncbi:hypothetical protein KAR91_64465 [Candidatus Pacearchaeota archaeon]|nr:hypothetical protein [Candidatus Pacearchaeota archaeon]